MTDIERSDIVVSMFGRDKGRLFFVVDRDDMFVKLCDGKIRRIEKPKRKKLKHVRYEAHHECYAAVKLQSGDKVTNNELRRALAEYVSNHNGDKGGM